MPASLLMPKPGCAWMFVDRMSFRRQKPVDQLCSVIQRKDGSRDGVLHSSPEPFWKSTTISDREFEAGMKIHTCLRVNPARRNARQIVVSDTSFPCATLKLSFNSSRYWSPHWARQPCRNWEPNIVSLRNCSYYEWHSPQCRCTVEVSASQKAR